LRLNISPTTLPSFFKIYNSHKQSFKFVKRLYCGLYRINEKSPDILSYFPSLTELRCSPRNVDNFSTLTNLTELSIPYSFSLQNVDSFEKLTNLIKLNMDFCKNLQNVDPITKLTKLKQLTIGSCTCLQNVNVFNELTN